MQVFREVKINYGGEELTLVPSNKLLRRIDAGLSPQTIFGVLGQLNGRETPLPALAYIISEMIKEAGGKETEDEVLQDLYIDVTENQSKGVREMISAISACITMPTIKDAEGNQSTRQAGAGKVKNKTSKPS